MEQHYLFLSSEDSNMIYPGNTGSEFIVQLPETLILEGLWYCSLKEFVIPNKQRKGQELNICSDFCEDSFVSGKRVGVLRRIYTTVGGVIAETFNQPYYIKVNSSHLNRLSFHIKNENLEAVDIKGRTLLTIHLRKSTIA